MVLNQPLKKLLTPNAGKLVNYNFFDTAAGTGYVTYYGGTMSGANILSNETFYSNSIISNGGLITSTAYILMMDKDFDVKFSVPTLIGGDFIVDMPLGFYHNGSSAVPTAGMLPIAIIRKWDGTTETNIASGAAVEWTPSVATSTKWNYKMMTARVNCPTTLFKKDDYLRMTILVYSKEGEINNNIPIFAHDPMNRSGSDGDAYTQVLASGSSIFKVQVPLKLDI